jgi:hypothetical protein
LCMRCLHWSTATAVLAAIAPVAAVLCKQSSFSYLGCTLVQYGSHLAYNFWFACGVRDKQQTERVQILLQTSIEYSMYMATAVVAARLCAVPRC